jgi:hypothetical protein
MNGTTKEMFVVYVEVSWNPTENVYTAVMKNN